MTELVLYSRAGCHLCDDMAEALAPLLAGRARLAVVDIDADAALREKYDWRVPVLVFENDVICEGRVDEDAVKDALRLT